MSTGYVDGLSIREPVKERFDACDSVFNRFDMTMLAANRLAPQHDDVRFLLELFEDFVDEAREHPDFYCPPMRKAVDMFGSIEKLVNKYDQI